MAAIKGAGAALVSLTLGPTPSPFARHPLTGQTLAIASQAELMAAAADLARRLGRTGLTAGAGTGRVTLEIAPDTGLVWLLVSADGDLSLAAGRDHPPAAALDLAAAAGRTGGAGGRGGSSYRLVRIVNPAAGTWHLEAARGQALGWLVETRDLPGLRLKDPPALYRGQDGDLTLEVFDPRTGKVPDDPARLRRLEVTASLDGAPLALHDDGTAPDRTAADGRFTARVRPDTDGTLLLKARLREDEMQRDLEVTLPVAAPGALKGPAALDFGPLAGHGRAVADLDLGASTLHGEAELALTADLHPGLGLSLGGTGSADGPPLTAATPVQVRLAPGQARWPLTLSAPRCPPQLAGAPAGTLRVRVLTGAGAGQQLEVTLRAEPRPRHWVLCLLPFLIAAAVLLLAAFIAWGFISPARFPRNLGLYLSPEEDLDEGFFQVICARKGTGSGFYRDARAYIGSDFSLSGRRAGALAGLIAGRPRPRLKPLPGQPLARRTPEGGWEPVADTPALIPFGVLHRNEAGTLYFELRNL